MNYKQSHSIRVSTGNAALDSKLVEKAHVSDKVWAKMTNSQKRIYKRREKILDLASNDELYCNAHKRYLCVRDVLEKKCYVRHGNPPVCIHLMKEISKGILQFYGKR